MKATRIKICVATIVLVGVAGFVALMRGPISYECIGASDPVACETKEIESSLAAHDVAGALAKLEFYTSNSPVFNAQCHHLIHEAGREAYQEFRSGRSPKPSTSWNSCNYGFYHGFMQALYAETGDFRYAQEFCVNPGEHLDVQIPRGQCFHGLGHGFMDEHGEEGWNDVPSLLKDSLSSCKTIALKRDDYQQCVQGAYHAVRNEFFPPTERFQVDLSDPFKYCNLGIEDADQQDCYGYIGQTLASIPPKSLESSLTLGLRYVPKAYTDSFVGGLALVFASRRVDDGALRTCRELKDGLSGVCSSNYAVGLLRRNPTGIGKDMAFKFCEKFEAGRAQSECFGKVLHELSNLISPEVAKSSCERVDVAAREVCFAAINTKL